MTALPVPRPEDVYDAETLAGFRAAGYWRDETLSAAVDRLAGQDRVLLTDGYGALTGGQLREQAYRLAAALRWLGVEAGDRVQVQLPNWNEFVVVYIALARIGAVLVPTMPIYRHDEVRYVLQHSGAKISVVAGEFRGFDYPGMLADIRASVPELQHVISVRCGERSGVLRFEDLIAGTGVPDPALLGEPPSADAPHCIIYTSGTESRPKGCLHTLNTITFTAAGTEGEICHGGPGLMLGYWRDPEFTAASIDDRGVSRSGDLGRVDEDGYLRVTGRVKDMIIRGGLNISAAEVENHLLAHPRVAAAAVVAAPDHRLGEKACAFVVARGEPPTLAELTDFLRRERRIAPQKLPEMLQVVDALPTTMTGKVQKFLLREAARALAEGVTGAR